MFKNVTICVAREVMPSYNSVILAKMQTATQTLKNSSKHAKIVVSLEVVNRDWQHWLRRADAIWGQFEKKSVD